MVPEQYLRIRVLGTRGSVPVCGDEFALYGGSTSCYLVEAGEERIFLDAGSGIVNAPDALPRDPVILLSHMHVDHLLGLGMYSRLAQPGTTTRLLVPARSEREAWEKLDRLYSPPLWPIRLCDYGGDLQVNTLPSFMRIGEVTVHTELGSHPGGCRLIKICFAGKTLVYATDFEHDDDACARLAQFAGDVDLLLYDGQYDEETYATHRGFGHSTHVAGLEVMRSSGARRLLIVHHDPHSTDAMLLERERSLGRSDVRFAREGEVIEL